jgi:hypothetical protein
MNFFPVFFLPSHDALCTVYSLPWFYGAVYASFANGTHPCIQSCLAKKPHEIPVKGNDKRETINGSNGLVEKRSCGILFISTVVRYELRDTKYGTRITNRVNISLIPHRPDSNSLTINTEVVSAS